jgi:hypothetical protein
VLANEQRLPHLWVSAGYAFLQGIIIILVIHNAAFTSIGLFTVILIPLTITYIFLKWFLLPGKAIG